MLEVDYVPPNVRIQPGEIFITSGQDGIFPKGIPCARVIEARQSDTSPFQLITAEPLADLDNQEEVLLLQTPAPGARIRHVREGPYGLGGKLPPIVPDIMPRDVSPEDLLQREYDNAEQAQTSDEDSLVPVKFTIRKVHKAKVSVMAIFPVTFAPPGKMGTNPKILLKNIKKNRVSR